MLKSCDWNISKAATQLGVERTNLHKKMRALGLGRESSPGGAIPTAVAAETSGPTGGQP
jgi:hypothetical protein